jgi:hypothetical protein
MSENQEEEDYSLLSPERAQFLTQMLYCFRLKNKNHRMNGEPEETIDQFIQNWNSEID